MNIDSLLESYNNGNKAYFYSQIKNSEYTVFSKLKQYNHVDSKLLIEMMLFCFYQQEN